VMSTGVVGLQSEDRIQKRKIKSEEIHKKFKSKWITREIAKGADQIRKKVKSKI
jgi:hypothetical protein